MPWTSDDSDWWMVYRSVCRCDWTYRNTDNKEAWSLLRSIWLLVQSIVNLPGLKSYSRLLRCWITSSYPHEQIFLEYFFVCLCSTTSGISSRTDSQSQEFLSAFLSFVLYSAILLCVRGNLIKSGGRWRFRFVPHGESWQLSVNRDRIDSAVFDVAVRMVWYPVRDQ